MRVVALIPAAGMGRRMGARTNKPFLSIGGKPILAHTLLNFENTDLINEVYVIVSKKERESLRKDIIERFNLQKVAKVITGGEERLDSVRNGLDAIESPCDIVMIHDGIRPFVTPQIIEESILKTEKYHATVVAVPVKETVKNVSSEGEIAETLDREKLWLAQTPQTFTYDIIKRAYKNASEKNIYGTDDSSLVELLGFSVKIIRGRYSNIKITTPDDLIIAEAFLRKKEDAMNTDI